MVAYIPITPEMLKKVEHYAHRGLTYEQIAHCVGMGESTLYEKFKIYPELKEAIKKGKAKGVAEVASNLLKNIEKGNVAAQIFYLKCQGGWKETTVVEASLNNQTENQITNDMIDKRIGDMIAKN